jgi:PAS domain-containing protein
LTNQQKPIEFEVPRPDDFQCGALITDKNRKIIYANSYFSDELNWQLETLIGKNSEDILRKLFDAFIVA